MSALERATAQVSYTAAQFSRAADQVPQLESVLEALEVQLFTVQTNAQTVVAANVAHLIAKWKWKDAEHTGRRLPNFCSLEPNKKIGFQISSFFVQNLLFGRFCHYKSSYLKHN